MTVRVAVQKDGVTAEDLRFALEALFAPAGALNARTGILPNAGIPADLVSVAALQAKVTPFQAWVDGTSNTMQAGYLVTSDADVTLTFGAGNGTNPRIDLIVLRVRDNPYDASGAQTGTVEIVAGTPAASPVVPAVPASSLALWEVLVPANASGGNPIVFASARTDRRAYTGARGEPIQVASITERSAIGSPYAGMAVYRNDVKWVERYDGTIWRVEGVAAVAAFANLATVISNPFDGQVALTTSDDTLWQYDAATTTWKPAAAGGAWTAWTPVITQGGGNVTYTVTRARYTKSGRTVNIMAELVVVSGAAAVAGQRVVISGLPFVSAYASYPAIGTAYIFDASASDTITGLVAFNGVNNALYLVGTRANGNLGSGSGFAAALAVGDWVVFEGTYEAAA